MRTSRTTRSTRALPFAALTAAAAVLVLAPAGPTAADQPASPTDPTASTAPTASTDPTASAAATDPTAPASPSGQPAVTTAGTSFLTATTVRPGQAVQVPASVGDYLYWSFAASAGQTDRVAVTVTLPPAADRHGDSTWTVDLFDGLRRRQACTTGTGTATAGTADRSVQLSCTLRRVRSWAESWSSDPLPGTYYVRLSTTALPEPDLGLAIQAAMTVEASNGDAQPDNGSLKSPLSPPVNAGATVAPDAGATPAPAATTSAPRPVARAKSRLSSVSSRWWWTLGGAALAAVAGACGYSLTRHPRRGRSAA